jgi:large exoprotein involved in heme utilization and adhesion
MPPEYLQSILQIENAGSGNAGTLAVNANEVTLKDSSLTAATAGGEGGNIVFSLGNLRLNNGNISASALNDGNGGNVTIGATTIVARNNSSITADAFKGRGGNIGINSRTLFLSADSKITASSEQGVDGTVIINTSQLNSVLSGVASSAFTPSEFTNTCSPEPPANFAFADNLQITGKGGIPHRPTDLFESTLGWTDTDGSPNVTKQVEQSQTQNNQSRNLVAQGWKVNSNGTVDFVVFSEPNEDLSASSSNLKSSCFYYSKVID